MILEKLQDEAYMLKMFVLGYVIDENVIKEDNAKFLEIWFQ